MSKLVRKPRADKGLSRDVGGCLFFLTFKNMWPDEWCRLHILDYFDDVITYCIALEQSKTCSGDTGEYINHLHCFFEFKLCWTLSELNSFVRDNICEVFDLQKVKSRRNVLKYISKEDVNLVFNCKLDELNFNYKCYSWACRNRYFSYNNSFVVEHRFCYNFLRKYHVQHWSTQSEFLGFLPCTVVYNNWADRVVNWYNNFINTQGPRRKQLFLYGPTSVGKTSLIESLFMNMGYCYFPDVGKFFMTGFEPGRHKFIVFEEFNLQYHIEDFLKRLLEGRQFSYPVKGTSPLELCYTGPVVFVSNDNIVCSPALQARLEIVYAETPYFS